MFRRNWGVLLLLLSTSNLQANETLAQRQQKQIELLIKQVQTLQNKLEKIETKQQTTIQADNLLQIEKKVVEAPAVDLSIQEHTSIEMSGDSHVLSNPWWKNIEVYGFAGVGYYDTGSAGTRDFGGFEIKESSLFIEAQIWEDIAFFLEIQANRLGKDEQLFLRTGEVYAHFRNLQIGELPAFGVKVGRIDIPFGEEYLWQDAIDNPLITTSAAFPYGWDEGVLLYSHFKGLNWILSVTDGSDARSIDTNSDKAVNLKLYGEPLESLYLSGSFMYNGDADKSAFEFGGSHFQAVGASHQSSVGNSNSKEVDAVLVELDAKYRFSANAFEGYFAASLGGAHQNDEDSTFDRNLFWFSIEPYISYKNTWYAVARYSEIGTYDNQEGYHFDGKIFASGNNSFGYDTKRFRRLALGLGWMPNPHVRAKFEFGQDWFDLIDASSVASRNNHRTFLGVEVAVGF